MSDVARLTEHYARVLLVVPVHDIRQRGQMPAALASLVHRLIMGEPVGMDELEAWDVDAMEGDGLSRILAEGRRDGDYLPADDEVDERQMTLVLN